MGDSLKFTIGGQIGASYRGALSGAVIEAQRANARINGVMSSRGGGHGHGGGRASMIEGIVVGREILEGRSWGRVLGSVTLLAQRMGLLNFIFKDGAKAADIVAQAYGAVAQKANANALALARKAEMSAAAFTADAAETEESLNQAVADETAAVAARAHATAMIEKAEAAQISAAAQGEEAVASGAGLGTLAAGLAVAAVVIGVIYERVWGVKKLLQDLSFDQSKIEIKDDYIPLLKRHISDARNEQKALNDEIKKSVDNYFSAAEAAKRVASATKDHFEHLRKMNQYSNRSPAEKDAEQLRIDAAERQAEIHNKQVEQANLQFQSTQTLAQAAHIAVPTKDEDEKTQSELNQRADAARAFLNRGKDDGAGDVWEQYKKQLAIHLGGASADLIEKTEAGGTDAANKAIQQADKYKDKVGNNDELRKQKADLEKTGNEAGAQAALIGASLPDLESTATQANADEAEEMKAKEAQQRGSERKITQTDWEKNGGSFGGPANIGALDILRQSLKAQQETAKNTRPSDGHSGSRSGAVDFGDGPGRM